VTAGTQTHRHEHEHHPHSDHDYTHNPMIRIQRLGLFLEAHFGEVEYHMPDEESETEEEELTSHGEPSFLIQLDDADARINLLSMVRPSLSISYLFPRLCQNPQTVDSSSEALRRRVEAVLEMAVSTVSSLSESFESGAPEEFSSGRIHKPKVDISPSDVAEGGAAQTVVDQNESSSPEVETQRPHD
jgi:cleavage and polyadenylation specificity factor subunit 3